MTVILRVPDGSTARVRHQQRLLEAVTPYLAALDVSADAAIRGLADLSNAASYDAPPPDPDTGIGIACWVLADDVGEAALTAWRTVEAATREHLPRDTTLWDLRLIPRAAMLPA